MKLYIKDNKIIKTIFSAGYETEIPVEGTDVVEMTDDNSYYTYEDGVKLYKDSQMIIDRKLELEAIIEKTEPEQQELDYILTLISL